MRFLPTCDPEMKDFWHQNLTNVFILNRTSKQSLMSCDCGLKGNQNNNESSK